MGLDCYFVRRKMTNIGHFRKINFLIKFFKDRGLDIKKQTPLLIKKKDIEVLLYRCNEVLNDHNKASELLPTTSGFFFGSTEYDEYYFDDVKQVKNYIIDTLINQFDDLDSNENIFFIIDY